MQLAETVIIRIVSLEPSCLSPTMHSHVIYSTDGGPDQDNNMDEAFEDGMDEGTGIPTAEFGGMRVEEDSSELVLSKRMISGPDSNGKNCLTAIVCLPSSSSCVARQCMPILRAHIIGERVRVTDVPLTRLHTPPHWRYVRLLIVTASLGTITSC
jgi:hypothetical protein